MRAEELALYARGPADDTPPDREVRWWAESGAREHQRASTKEFSEYLTAAEVDSHIAEDADFVTLALDIKRTINFETLGMQQYRDSCPLESKDEFLSRMDRILRAACARQQVEGKPIEYTQGMNYLASMVLLTVPDEVSAFWLFCTLIEDILGHNYFCKKPMMLGLQADSVVYHELLCEICPKLAEAFGQSRLREFSTLLAMKWFMSGFVDLLPMPVMLWLWDALICMGGAHGGGSPPDSIFRRSAIFQLSLALVMHHEARVLEIVKESDPDDMEAGVTVMLVYSEIVQGASTLSIADQESLMGIIANKLAPAPSLHQLELARRVQKATRLVKDNDIMDRLLKRLQRAQAKNDDATSDFLPRIITARPSSWQSTSPAAELTARLLSGGQCIGNSDSPTRSRVESSSVGDRKGNGAVSGADGADGSSTGGEVKQPVARPKQKKRTGRVVTASASRWKQRAEQQENNQKEMEGSSVFDFVTSLFG